MKADDGQLIVGCGGITRIAPVAFGAQFPLIVKQTVGNGFSRRDGLDARGEEAIHVFRADLEFRVVAKEVITRRETADDDDVFPEISRDCSGDALQHGAGRNELHNAFLIHSGRPLVAGKDLRNSSACDSRRASCRSSRHSKGSAQGRLFSAGWKRDCARRMV